MTTQTAAQAGAGGPADHRLPGETAFDPAAALRDGVADAATVWLLHLARKCVWPLAFVGTIVLAITHHRDSSLSDLGDAGEWLRALWSPLVFLILALALRLLSSWIGFVVAYPLSHRARAVTSAHPGRAGAFGRWSDRVHLTRAYRSIRRTKPVRDVAAERLGPRSARRLRRAERVVTWSLPTLFVAAIVVTSIATPNA